MQAWTNVKVIDESLELHGKAGKVVSAAPYKPEGETLDHVDVHMDDPDEVHTFALTQLQVLG